MRKVEECQFGLGRVPIAEIALDPKSRDDIPAVLKGLQLLYEQRRAELWALLEAGVCPESDHRLGRPGMDLWRILVLGVLKQGLDCDFDRLHELANQHRTVRAMLGHGDFDEHEYQYQTVVDNVSLLTPELLRAVNRLVVETGHRIVKKKPGAILRGRCDSFVAKTNVRHPTDVGLLMDSVRCMVREVVRACDRHDVGGWRQHAHLTQRAQRLARQVCTAKRRRRQPEAVGEYVALCRKLAERTVGSVVQLERAGAPARELEPVLRWLADVSRQVDQVERRLLLGEKIPHSEKVFSVFEPHTRWVSKGKAGNPVELGVPVCVVEDQHRFVLEWAVLWEGEDVHVAVPLIEAARTAWPDLRACSFDKGFHSPANRARLDALLPDGNVLPQKGRLGKAAKAREFAPAFVAARRRHPSVESGDPPLAAPRPRSRSDQGSRRLRSDRRAVDRGRQPAHPGRPAPASRAARAVDPAPRPQEREATTPGRVATRHPRRPGSTTPSCGREMDTSLQPLGNSGSAPPKRPGNAFRRCPKRGLETAGDGSGASAPPKPSPLPLFSGGH